MKIKSLKGDFQSRVIKNYLEILDKLNSKNKLLIIAHAGVIRVIKSYILKLPVKKCLQ